MAKLESIPGLAPDLGETFADLLPAVEETIRRPIDRMPTGFASLDGKLGGGLPNPGMVVIGAPPKVGKTTIGQTIMERHLDRGQYGAYIDLENGLEVFARNMLMRAAQLTDSELAHPTEDERERIEHSLVAMRSYGRRLIYQGNRQIQARELEASFSALRRAAGDRARVLVVIDSLQKLPRQQEARAAIDQWIRWIEDMRDTYRLLIVVVSELHRPKGGREGYTPKGGTGYKESGDIEYTADLTLDLWPQAGERFNVTWPWNRHGRAVKNPKDGCAFWLDGERHTIVEK